VARRVDTLIDGLQYERFYLDNRRGPVPVDRLQSHHWLNTNFLLCPPDRAGALGLPPGLRPAR
jgi:hypothetical protein